MSELRITDWAGPMWAGDIIYVTDEHDRDIGTVMSRKIEKDVSIDTKEPLTFMTITISLHPEAVSWATQKAKPKPTNRMKRTIRV